jgi:response regulator of citrate/malate metabolism
MTKKSTPEHLPRLKQYKQRRVFTELMLGLDALFRATLEGMTIEGTKRNIDARYVLEIRHVFQRVLACHLKGETATAHEIAKASGLSRETVRRILDDLVGIRWLDRNGSHFWISARTAKMPAMPLSAYDKATKLVIAAAKELRSKKKK